MPKQNTTKKTKKKKGKVGAPFGNLNAQKWSLAQTKKIFLEAIKLTDKTDTYYVGKDRDIEVIGYSYEFLGEIAREQKLYKDFYINLIERFPELKNLYNILKSRLESNCYANSKKGFIDKTIGIVNLKANYGWKDTVHTEHSGKITQEIITKEEENELQELIDQTVRSPQNS